MKKKNVVLSLSGGMDSSTLLLRCLNEYENIVCVSFDYGQKHKEELNKARELVEYLNLNPHRSFITPSKVTINYPQTKHRVIELKGLSELLVSGLIEGGTEVPEGHYEQSNMKETVVPNRNKLFSSIIQSIALSIANETEECCDIAMGIHAGDFNIYPDCRPEFRDADQKAFRLGNWNWENVKYFTPYLEGMKIDILKDGVRLCEELGLKFKEIYKRTITSYKLITIEGKVYSDYKSASSVERIEAFIKLDKKDPTLYADQNGPVKWETAKNHVMEVLKNHLQEKTFKMFKKIYE